MQLISKTSNFIIFFYGEGIITENGKLKKIVILSEGKFWLMKQVLFDVETVDKKSVNKSV